jgi:hypothetical protein
MNFLYVLGLQGERPADLNMTQPNVPAASMTGHIPPARLVRGALTEPLNVCPFYRLEIWNACLNQC